MKGKTLKLILGTYTKNSELRKKRASDENTETYFQEIPKSSGSKILVTNSSSVAKIFVS